MSHIYVANEVGTNLFKIGRTASPSQRLNALRVGSAHDIRMFACDKFEHPEFAEKTLHDKWRNKHVVREWFGLTDDEVREVYSDMDKLGAIHCHCSKQCRGNGTQGKCLQKGCKYA